MNTRTTAPQIDTSIGGALGTGVVAAAIAATANSLVYLLARVAGVSFVMPLSPGAEPAVLPIGMVILGSVVGAALGTIAFVLLGRLAPDRPSLFPILGIAFLVLSFAAPLTLEATDSATKATLVLMHVVAGSTIIRLLSSRSGADV